MEYEKQDAHDYLEIDHDGPIVVSGNTFTHVKDFRPYARPMIGGDIGVKEVTLLRANL